MNGKNKVLPDIFPITTTKAVYLDGTSKTLHDYLAENGTLGQSVNICPPTFEFYNSYFDYQTGEKKALNGYGSTGLIEVHANTTYTKNISSNVTFWAKDGSFIGGVNANGFTTPAGCKYIRSSGAANMEGKIFIVQSNKTLNIPSLPYHLRTVSQKINHPNAKIPLLIETYDGTNQPTHPKLISFPESWNGYKYWLVYTPYPDGQPATENPCIAVSNNLYYWTTPNGMTNPLVPSPQNAGMSNYNSDAHLVYRADTDTLECWYREVAGGNTETIKRVTSKNGVAWTAPETLHTVTGNVLQVICPIVLWDNERYAIWVATDGRIKKYTSQSGSNWAEVGFARLNGIEGIDTWHFDVIKTEDGYELLNYTGRSDSGTLTHFVSVDGNDWAQSDFLMKPSENPSAFDARSLYKSTFIKEGGKYVLIYAGVSNDNKWQIGLAKSEDEGILSLKGMDAAEARFMNKPTRKNPLANELDYFYDQSSGKLLFCVNKNGNLTWIDSTGSVV